MNRRRRRLGAIALALGAAALLPAAGCERTAPPASPPGPPLRVGASYWPGQYWVDIAHAKGWFREAGVNVDWVDTNADYFGSFGDLVAGRLDIVAFALFDLVRHAANGDPVVGFLASDTTHGAEALVARPGIERVRDLAGKRVGLSRGTYLEYLWEVVRERAGLPPGAVQLVDVPGEKVQEALARGAVDAVLSWEPFARQARSAVGGQTLFDTAQIPGISWAVFSARRDLLDRRGAEIAAFLRVWQRTSAYLREHPDEALAIVAQVNRKSVGEVRAFMQLDRLVDLRGNQTAFSFAPGFASLHGAARRVNDFMLARGLTAQRIDTARVFDPRFVRELAAAAPGR